MTTPNDREELINAENLALGLAALKCPLWQDPMAFLADLSDREREGFRAKARFLLSFVKGLP